MFESGARQESISLYRWNVTPGEGVYEKIPMTAPVMQVASVPATSAFMPSADDLVPPLRRKAAEAADEDAEAAEVRKAAQGIGHDQPASRIKRLCRELRHFEERQQLIQDRLGAHEVARGLCLRPGNPEEPDDRRHNEAEDSLQGERLPTDVREQADEQIRTVARGRPSRRAWQRCSRRGAGRPSSP